MVLKLTSTKYGENANSECARMIQHVSYVKFYRKANLSLNEGLLMEGGRTYRGQHPRCLSHVYPVGIWLSLKMTDVQMTCSDFLSDATMM